MTRCSPAFPTSRRSRSSITCWAMASTSWWRSRYGRPMRNRSSSSRPRQESNGAVCYVAYNHRFEPHFVRMRETIVAGTLGALYHCRMFYGNGTARLVRESRVAGQGCGRFAGSRLASPRHRAILVRRYRRGCSHRVEPPVRKSRARTMSCSPRTATKPQLELEMTLLSWRNHFTCDLFAENGSAHIRSLCKWGPSSFTLRRRLLPSGRPPEDTVTLDPGRSDLGARICAFQECSARGKRDTDLSNDIRLNRLLRRLAQAAIAQARQ